MIPRRTEQDNRCSASGEHFFTIRDAVEFRGPVSAPCTARARPHLLPRLTTYASRTRTHFTLQHWLLYCVYRAVLFEFEFAPIQMPRAWRWASDVEEAAW